MKFGLYVGDVILSKFWTGWGFPGAKEITCGPYRIEQITGPCTCAPYNTAWNMCCHLPSEPHYHLSCTDIRPGIIFKKGGASLHGYVEKEGRFIGVHAHFHPYTHLPYTDHPDEELFIVERAVNVQLDFFK